MDTGIAIMLLTASRLNKAQGDYWTDLQNVSGRTEKQLSEQKRGSRCLWSHPLAAGWLILIMLAAHQAAPEAAEISRSIRAEDGASSSRAHGAVCVCACVGVGVCVLQIVLTNEKNEIHFLLAVTLLS